MNLPYLAADVTADQFELLLLLVGHHGNITVRDLQVTLCSCNKLIDYSGFGQVCGDDDQSIYGWRGIPVQSFDMFNRAFPGRQSVVLAQTYRSSYVLHAFR